MTHTTLISTAQLRALQESAQPLVLLDCSFELTDAGAGQRQFLQGHLPGAQYAHLDHDLSGEKTGTTGRHPLPPRQAFAATAGRWGVAPGVQVVAYDAQGGPYASRVWWLLRWLGHEAVAVLDGGLQAWTADGGPLTTAPADVRPAPPYPATEDVPMPTVDAAQLLAGASAWTVLDARAPERFRGEVEPLDPVAGHIPGAVNRCFKDNLDAHGRFLPVEALRQAFAPWAADPDRVVHQCGSGVTACHNLLAMTHAGWPGSRLYPGSWSEWCADPARPVERG